MPSTPSLKVISGIVLMLIVGKQKGGGGRPEQLVGSLTPDDLPNHPAS